MASEHDTPTDPSLTAAIRALSDTVRIVIESQERQTNTQDRILRRDLRWRNLRAALLCLSMVGGALIYSLGLQRILAPQTYAGPYAALVRIEGLIDADQRANASKVSAALSAAYEDTKAKGVIVLINSPGGSPVQSALIHDHLLTLRARFPNKPLWVIGEDMLTSGAYYVAVAADRICVNRSTMTGSIGVILSGWGFDRAIERLDIERRVFTAGTNKSRLDAFKPLTSADQAKATQLLDAIHQQFIAAVKAGRGDRLKGATDALWSGDYWTGEQAASLGLVDGLCDLHGVADRELGVRELKDYTAPPNVWAKLANSFGVLAEQVLSTAELGAQPRLLP